MDLLYRLGKLADASQKFEMKARTMHKWHKYFPCFAIFVHLLLCCFKHLREVNSKLAIHILATNDARLSTFDSQQQQILACSVQCTYWDTYADASVSTCSQEYTSLNIILAVFH